MSKKSSLPINPETNMPITNVRVDGDEAAKLRQSLPAGADAPGGMRRIISLSPLAKIFQPYVNLDRFLEDPAAVFKDEPFDIVFENSWSTRNYRFGDSILVTELEALYLVGTDNNRFERSTGGTGFVYFNVPEDMLAAFNYTKKTGKKADKELEEQLSQYLEQAKALSEKRVRDFMKDKYNMLYTNRQFIESQGGKAMAPNDMEMLITFVLNEDIKRASDKRKKLRQAFEQAQKELHG